KIRREIGILDLHPIVKVKGEPRPHTLPALIAATDVGLVTAGATPRFLEFGDLPQPLLEIPACRRPLIASAVPAVVETFRDEEDALLYPPGDEDSLLAAIVTLLESQDKRRHLSSSGYEKARSSFNSGVRRRLIVQLYDYLCRGSQSFDAWESAFER